VKLKAVELVNALNAHFEQLNVLTQTSVNVNQNVVKAELGNFLLFASFVDVAPARDEAVLGFFKTLTDDAGTADRAVLAVDKLVTEYGYTIDDQRMNLGKGAFDPATASDVRYLGFAKAVNDVVSAVSDQVSRGTGKALGDVVGTAEALAFALTNARSDTASSTDNDVIAFVKALADHGFLAEAIDTLAFGKGLSDAPVASDAIDSFGLTKALTDTVTFTDDIDGAASILDDQEMQFRKIKSNIASAAETFTRQVGYNRLFSDNSIASETHYVVTGKHLSDIPVATETLVKSLTRQRSDSALFGDASVVTSGKVLLNLASSTDAGSLRSQGYTDFTYFAEDFVGASTTF